MIPTRPLPPSLVEQVRRLEDGLATPVAPRPAASVVLMRAPRDGRPALGALEVYFLRRQRGMAFAGGMAVFPGGGVDPRDHDAHDDVVWAGPAPTAWAERLGVDVADARALVYAAVRETFEESGVLLAGPTPDRVVADTTGADWEADRVALESRALSFSEFLTRRSLVVRTDLLTPWSLWITPIFEPRRFRTWFFLAELPEGQRTRDVSSESSEVMWLSVADALRACHADTVAMMPPQYCTCLELYDSGTPAEAAATGRHRELASIQPTARFHEDRAHLEIPHRLVELDDHVRALLAETADD